MHNRVSKLLTSRLQLGQLEHVQTELFGRDTVMAFRFKND